MPTTLTSAPLVGAYDYRLVALSVLISMIASYVALHLGGRVTASRGRVRLMWLSGSSVTMGLGIWAMHYVGMLAWTLPVVVLYDWPTVLASLLAAILASGVALFVASRQVMEPVATGVGGLVMGIGIASMHYVGMEAMRLPAVCHYSPALVAWSVILAIVISLGALRLTFNCRNESTVTERRKVASAALMGAAISVMHYTGMAAVTFLPMATVGGLTHAVAISSLGTILISGITLLVLGLTDMTSRIGRRLSAEAISRVLSVP